MATQAPSAAGRVPSPLLNPAYRQLFIAQVISLLGTGVTTVALALLAFELAGKQAGEVLGTALALKMVAYVLVAPMVGGIAHRLPRKHLLVALDLGRAVLVLGLPWVSEIWQIYLLIFLINCCSAGFTPVFQSIIPELLPDEARYTRALSYSRLAYDLENLLSPTLAALLLGVMSFTGLFMLDAGSFVISALLVALTLLPQAMQPERPGSVRQQVMFGIHAYLSTPRLRGLLCLYLVVALAGAMVIVNTVVYVQAHLGLTEQHTAWLLMASGCGSMLAALLLPRMLDRHADRPLMLGGALLIVLTLAISASLPGFQLLLLLWFLLGLGWSLIQTPAGRVVNRSCRSTDRAAFYSANFALSHAAWLLAYLLAGYLGSLLGLSATCLLLAALALLATLAAILFWPQNDPRELTHRHPEQYHLHPHYHDDAHHQHAHEGWEGPEPHVHEHRHSAVTHRHIFVIDAHHDHWPQAGR